MKQQVSALMDADMHNEDANQVMNVMESSSHLRRTWAEYHLIGDVMRGEPTLSVDFTAKLMHQLSEEPVVLAPRAQQTASQTRLQSLSHPVWALAASVVAVGYVAWFVVQELQPSQQPMMNAAQDDYLLAHQSAAPSNTAYLLETVAFEK